LGLHKRMKAGLGRLDGGGGNPVHRGSLFQWPWKQELLMKRLLVAVALAAGIALPAVAQPVVPPAGPGANPAVNAQIAHHDAQVARRAARHGNYRKAAIAHHASGVAAAQSADAPR
jgi:hypothetical protein